MSLGKVSIAIEAAMASFESDMGRAARLMEKETRRMERDAKRLEEQVKKVGVAIGAAIAGAVTAITYNVKKSIDHMDSMAKAADRVGMSTEHFSQLAYAGSLADVSMSDLQSSIGRLVRTQSEAMTGTGRQAELFRKLGIAVQDSNGNMRASRDVLRDFADWFQRNQGRPEAIAAGMEIFGRSFQNIIPLIKGGSEGLAEMADESDRFGATVRDDAARAAEQFNDNLQRMRTQLGGVVQDIASGMLPTLLALTDQTEKAGQRTEEFTDLGRGLAQVLVVAANTIDVVARATRSLAMIFAEAAQQGGRLLAIGQSLAKGNLKGALGGMADWAGGNKFLLSSLSGEWSKGYLSYEDKMPELPKRPKPIPIPEFPSAGGGKGGRSAPAGKSDAEREAERLQQRAEQYLQTLHRQTAMLGQVGEAATARYELEHGELAALDPMLKAKIQQEAELADAERERYEAAEKERAQRERDIEAAKRQQEALDEYIAGLEFELSLIGKSHVDREKMIALRYANADAASEEARRIKELIDEINDKQAWESARDTAAGLFTDVLSDIDRARDSFARFLDDMKRRLIAMAAERLFEKLFQVEGQTGTGGGNFWMQLVGALFGGRRAIGGPVSAGRLYEVGEGNRPELLQQGGKTYLIPGNDGNVIPATQGGVGGGAVQVIVNNHGAKVSTREQRGTGPDGRQMRQFVIDIVADSMNGGQLGALGKARYGWREAV